MYINCIFLVCKLLYSIKAALAASLIYAIYPFSIYTSKLGLVENALNLFGAITIFFLILYLVKKDIQYLFLCGFFGVLTYDQVFCFGTFGNCIFLSAFQT